MKKFLSYILLAVMCVSLLTGCNRYTTTRDGRNVVTHDGTVTNRGTVRDTDGIIDGVDGDGRIVRDGDGRRTVYDGDGNGRTIYDGDGKVVDRADGRTDGRVDGNTRRGVGNVTDNTKRATR